MKKILSCLIALLIALSSLSLISFSSFGTESDTMDIDEFSKQIRKMVAEYKPDNNSDIQTYSAEAGEDLSEFETMRLIVKSDEEIDTLNAVSVISGYRDLWVLQFESANDAAEAFEYYSALDKVEYVEPDRIVTLNTSEFSVPETRKNGHLSWGSEVIGSDEVLKYLTDNSIELAEVKVGIIDIGIDNNHEFLKDRLIDEGLNFTTSGDDTGMTEDGDSHGTHAAGIIVDNSPSSVKLRSYKAFDFVGTSSDAAVIAAIDKAADDGMDIILCNFQLDDSEASIESLLNAYNGGVTIVSSIGDGKTIEDRYIPGTLNEAINVGAAGIDLLPTKYSGSGKSLDFIAPGDNIYSTYNNNEYGLVSSTSAASAFAAASAAILIGMNPDLTPAQVEKRLKDNAVPIDAPCPTIKCGSGMLNISRALNAEYVTNAEINIKSGIYQDSVTVEFTAAPNIKVYYTTDNSFPTEAGGTLYTEPFTVTETCDIKWKAYSDDPKILSSGTDNVKVQIFSHSNESEFTVSESGELTGYTGTKSSVIVPKTVGGVTVTSVGENAFNSESGAAFKEIILPDTVVEIKDNAFNSNTAIEYVAAKGAETIGASAFENCAAFTALDAPKVKVIKASAFQKCEKFSGFNSFDVELIHDYAFENVKGITELKLDKLIGIGFHAFSNSNLTKVTLSSLKDFSRISEENSQSSGAFIGCDFLEELYMPELETFHTSLFVGSFGYNLFESLDSLRVFSAPKLRRISEYAFRECYSLETVDIENAEVIDNRAFDKCSSLKKLYLPKVKKVYNAAFAGSGLEYIYFGALEECSSCITSNCSVVVPASTTKVLFDSVPPKGHPDYEINHIKIYGTKGSYVETWSAKKHYRCTTEFVPFPVVKQDLPAEIRQDDGKLAVDAWGFNITYQWYGSIDGTTENSVKLDGQTDKDLTLADCDRYKGYFCVITDHDGEFVNSVNSNVSSVIYNPADYSEYNAAVASVPAILTIYTAESVAALQEVLSVDVSGKTALEQKAIDAQTKAILDAIAALQLRSADYAELDAALKAVPGDLTIYTDESRAELDALLASIDRELDITKQEQVDKWAKDIDVAVKALVLKPADYTALKNALAAIPADLSAYTPESVAALQEIVDGIDYSLDITQQDKVDEYTRQVLEATENLKKECLLIRLFRAIISFFKKVILIVKNFIFGLIKNT